MGRAGVLIVIASTGCNALFGVDGLSADEHVGGATSATTATGGGGGGGDAPESCLNGVDDDGDDLADCEDPDCAPGYTCVPTSELTPLALVAAESDCPAEAPPRALSRCDCTCEATPGDCGFTFAIHAGPGCASQITTVTDGGACTTAPNGERSIELVATTDPVGAGCTAGEAETVAEPLIACEPVALGSCADPGEVCIPKPHETADLCVIGAPAAGCPAEYPEARGTAFDGTLDGCSCSCAMEAACEPAVMLAAPDNSCSVTTSHVVPAMACVELGFVESMLFPDVGAAVACTAVPTAEGKTRPLPLCCQR